MSCICYIRSFVQFFCNNNTGQFALFTFSVHCTWQLVYSMYSHSPRLLTFASPKPNQLSMFWNILEPSLAFLLYPCPLVIKIHNWYLYGYQFKTVSPCIYTQKLFLSLFRNTKWMNGKASHVFILLQSYLETQNFTQIIKSPIHLFQLHNT